ncbi:MAG: hypothetical protein ACXADU_07680 [Promethearchaeota archaeon]
MLYEKDPITWEIIPDEAWGNLKYNHEGPDFKYEFYGFGLTENNDFDLIYYANDWPGNNPGALIDSGSTDADGYIHLSGSIDLNIDLPDPNDANYPGAKIWLVLSDDYDTIEYKMLGWNPGEYLFENNFITYNDTDV